MSNLLRIGQKVRLAHSIRRLQDTLSNLQKALTLTPPIGHEAAQAVTQTAVEIAMQIAAHDAFALAARDGRQEPDDPAEGGGDGL